MYSYISIVASHLDTLYIQRVDVEHVKMEPQDDVGGRILKRGPAGATEDPAQGRKGLRPCLY